MRDQVEAGFSRTLSNRLDWDPRKTWLANHFGRKRLLMLAIAGFKGLVRALRPGHKLSTLANAASNLLRLDMRQDMIISAWRLSE